MERVGATTVATFVASRATTAALDNTAEHANRRSSTRKDIPDGAQLFVVLCAGSPLRSELISVVGLRRELRVFPLLEPEGLHNRLRLCGLSWPDAVPNGGCCMAIVGAHVLLYSSEPEALRTILRDVFGWKHIDAGDGWLIFALPPAEVAVHPAEGPSQKAAVGHEFTLMCDDIEATIGELRSKGVDVKGDPEDQGWGITVMLSLPGGVEMLLYEPRHPVATGLPRT